MGDAAQKYCRAFERHGIAKLELVPAAVENLDTGNDGLAN
jgi:hypothetical protein